MSRASQNKIYKIKKAIADILYNRKDDIKFIEGKPSPSSIATIIKEEYGYNITRQTVAKYLDEGMDNYKSELITEDNDNVVDIKEAMRIQKSIWNNPNTPDSSRTKAATAWRQLQKQLIEYEKDLRDAELKKKEVERPNYLIKIIPRNVKVTCPKCGHEWYDIPDNNSKEKNKKSFFKKDKNQAGLYDNEEN